MVLSDNAHTPCPIQGALGFGAILRTLLYLINTKLEL
jgi:hypothetical protein